MLPIALHPSGLREALNGEPVILGNADVYWDNVILNTLLADERIR